MTEATHTSSATAVQEPVASEPMAAVSDVTVNSVAVADAIATIDKALAEMLRRELVSAGEVGDLLLDLRSLLTQSA